MVDVSTLPDQSGRIALVTGANTGLGFHNAHDLAAKGATVVLACRTESRAHDAMARISDAVPHADLHFLQLDLSSLSAVRASAAEFRSRHKTLDVLINNAGIMMPAYQQTVDGFESQMAANYWGHFLLTMSLIDLMPDVSTSRVVTVSSLAHAMGTKQIRFEDIHWERSYSRAGAYQQSKLACLMFTLELDRRLKRGGKQLLSVGAHPGISETELGRTMPKALTLAFRYTFGPFMTHAPSKGSLPTLVAAIADGVSGGDYFGPQGRREYRGNPGPAIIDSCAQDMNATRRLWDLSVKFTGADLPF